MIPALIIVALVAALAAVGYHLGVRRPIAVAQRGVEFHSTPDYYGWYTVALMFAAPAVLSLALLVLERFGVMSGRGWYWEIRGYLYAGVWVILPALLLLPAVRSIHPGLRARVWVERLIMGVLITASSISILTTLGIVLSVLFESVLFFRDVPLRDFLFGTTWNPDSAFKAGAGREASGEADFGAVPIFAGTLLITLIALLVAVPIGIFSAVYMSEYASLRARRALKPMLEVLAGIPTVVYGFFAALTVGPLIADVAGGIGLGVSEQNALAPGIIMGVMIIPFMSSLSDDVISSVPRELRSGALALGSTKAETIKKIVLPAAFPGIVSAVLLSFSRAVGETMIVVMAAGVSANLTANPLEEVTTVTVQIVKVLTGDVAFDSPFTRSAFALGLTLALITLLLNVVASVVIRRFRQQYE